MTPDERNRLNALEVSAKELQVKVNFYDRILDRMDKSLEQNGQALKTLVRLEERHQALDRTAAATSAALAEEINGRKTSEDGIYDRLRKLEGEGGMSSHFRTMMEYVIKVSAAGVLATALLWVLQNSGGS